MGRIIFEEGDFALVEIDENSYSLIYYTAHRHERHIGSIDLERDYSDHGKAMRLLKGPSFKIIVSKPYDPETDSDAERIGELFEREEAIKTLWEIRHSINRDYAFY